MIPTLLAEVIPLAAASDAVVHGLLHRWRIALQHVCADRRPEPLTQTNTKLDPERRTLGEQESSCAQPKKNDNRRYGFLPSHFLLGIAQTSTGVIRPTMVET